MTRITGSPIKEMSRDIFLPSAGGADTFGHPAPLRGRAVMLIVVGPRNSRKKSDSKPPLRFHTRGPRVDAVRFSRLTSLSIAKLATMVLSETRGL